jgi:hypothetical protein
MGHIDRGEIDGGWIVWWRDGRDRKEGGVGGGESTPVGDAALKAGGGKDVIVETTWLGEFDGVFVVNPKRVHRHDEFTRDTAGGGDGQRIYMDGYIPGEAFAAKCVECGHGRFVIVGASDCDVAEEREYAKYEGGEKVGGEEIRISSGAWI